MAFEFGKNTFKRYEIVMENYRIAMEDIYDEYQENCKNIVEEIVNDYNKEKKYRIYKTSTHFVLDSKFEEKLTEKMKASHLFEDVEKCNVIFNAIKLIRGIDFISTLGPVLFNDCFRYFVSNYKTAVLTADSIEYNFPETGATIICDKSNNDVIGTKDYNYSIRF